MFPLPLLKLFYPSTGNFITIVGALSGGGQAKALKQAIDQYTDVPAFSINAPRFIPGVDFSDHISYWEHGFPAVMVTDTAFYRNSAYHSKADTPDRLDYRRMAQVVYGISRYVITLAGR
jgi:Zn-dependent M28 family amino/carboxypeptidase